MNDRVLRLFLELHDQMPRQGPGDAQSTRRAFSALEKAADLPERPQILDLGCGPGAQTLELAGISAGMITAVDTHRPYLDQVSAGVERHGLGERIKLLQADMQQLAFAPASFDLVWSEGAIYIMGFERGLRAWRSLLRERGSVAVTEATWLKPDPPRELAAFWNEGYPAMQDVAANLDVLRSAGFRPLDHFTLPESAWWNDNYAPLEKRLDALEQRLPDDAAAQELVAAERREIEMFTRYSDFYGYVFFVAQCG